MLSADLFRLICFYVPQLCTTMCNSSFQINDTLSVFDESVIWVFFCKGHFGSFVLFVTLVLFFIVGTPIHCWTLWVLIHGNIKPNSVFPLNINIVELFFCIHSIIYSFITNYPTVTGDRLVVFCIGLFWTVRPLLQIFMCMKHYLAVIHPVTFLRYKGTQYRIASAAAAWLIGAANSVRLIFIGIEYFPDRVFFLVFCIAVTIISFCCASVLYALKRPGPGERTNVEMTRKDRHNKTDRGRAVENQQKRKAFKIISHSLASILVCYFPQVVAYFMRIAKMSKHTYICNAFPLILSFSLTAVLISPLVRIYNEGQIKEIMCFSKLREQIKGK